MFCKIQKKYDLKIFLLSLAILLASIATGAFFCVIIFCAKSFFQLTAGEFTGAIGSVIGGIIGAGGAFLAVNLSISRQKVEEEKKKAEEIEKVSEAVITEITMFTKYGLDDLNICKNLYDNLGNGLELYLKGEAIIRKAIDNLVWLKPVIYPAVADKIGLLPNPNDTVEFYIRIEEAKNYVEMLQIISECKEKKIKEKEVYIFRKNPNCTFESIQEIIKNDPEIIKIDKESFESAKAIIPYFAYSLVKAFEHAETIIRNNGNNYAKNELDKLIRDSTLQQITPCIKSTIEKFISITPFKETYGVLNQEQQEKNQCP